MLRNQAGDLHIDAEGVTFRSSDGKTSVTIPMKDLREADVADPHALRFQTYEVQKWRADRAARIYVPRETRCAGRGSGAIPGGPCYIVQLWGTTGVAPNFEVAAYHRRTLGGADGTLEIGQDSIRFVSGKRADSRTWLYRDIETIGKPDSFRFRVTTNRETYIVELKSELPDGSVRACMEQGLQHRNEREMNH